MDPAFSLIVTSGITAVASVMAAALGAFAVIRAGQARSAAVQTHELVNSRMTELLEITRKAALAEGVIEGVSRQGA